MATLAELLIGRKVREQELSTFLAAPTGEPPGLRESLQTGREKFFGERLGGLPASFQPALGEATALQKGVLERELEPQLARIKQQRLKDRVALIYDNAVRQQLEAGADFRSAQQFALQVAEDERQRQETEKEFQRKVQTAKEKQKIAEEFSKRGVALQESFQEPDPFEEALSRALGSVLGVASTFGVIKGIQKLASHAPAKLTPFVSNQLQQSSFRFPTLRQQLLMSVPGSFR